jgi:hypothetical protein
VFRIDRDSKWWFRVPTIRLISGDLQMKRKTFERNEWRRRVNPVFVRYWSAIKRERRVDAHDRKECKYAHDEVAVASRLLATEQSKIQNSNYSRIWPEIIRPLDGEVWPGSGEPGKRYAVNPEASAFFRDLVFLKFGITYRELITLAENDQKAHRMLLRVHRDYFRFRWSGNGFDNLRLKFNLNHFEIIAQGLDYGLDRLNEFELGSCLNEICPCAQRHSTEYLKKLRARMKKACGRLLESAKKPTSFKMPGA